MKLGLSSYTYGWACGAAGTSPPDPMTPRRLVARAAELGVHLVQICDNLPLDALTGPELDDLARAARDDGVGIEVGTRGIGPANLERQLALAVRFGSPILRVVIDTADHRPGEDEVVATVRAFEPELRAAGVVLAIENHDRFRARTLARIVERVDSEHVGVCLDTVNSFGALEGPEVVVDVLGPSTVNLHVKDFVVRRVPSNMGFVVEGRPAGQGMLDVPWLLGALHRRGRDVNAIVELWTPPEERLEETLRKEAAWAAESVAYLRRLIPD